MQLSLVAQVSAQNIKRIEEEAIKDKERDVKVKEYLLNREREERQLLEKPITPEEMENRNLVEVEPNNILPSDLISLYALVPYKIRRPRWGHMFAITYSLFNPTSYDSDYDLGTSSFEDLYGSAPMIEVSYTYKWNFQLGSLGGEIGYGTYTNDADDTAQIGTAKLNVQLIRAGVKFVADNFMHEPIIAPYAFGGVYTALYNETQPGVSFNGTTGAAGYFGVGALFQLSWLDRSAAVEAYTESGIENTYVFAEARSYLASSAENDPDFSTNFDLNFGLNLEF
ncbi:MAG: hypothetical protein KDD38_03190 [Bdellovibrionales bacterium]|nr:hypothetical protein [Bdellovibrionales bacterium]